jgi:hypothetical protein
VGCFTTQALKDADVDITLIARTTHRLFQPLLHKELLPPGADPGQRMNELVDSITQGLRG